MVGYSRKMHCSHLCHDWSLQERALQSPLPCLVSAGTCTPATSAIIILSSGLAVKRPCLCTLPPVTLQRHWHCFAKTAGAESINQSWCDITAWQPPSLMCPAGRVQQSSCCTCCLDAASLVTQPASLSMSVSAQSQSMGAARLIMHRQSRRRCLQHLQWPCQLTNKA